MILHRRAFWFASSVYFPLMGFRLNKKRVSESETLFAWFIHRLCLFALHVMRDEIWLFVSSGSKSHNVCLDFPLTIKLDTFGCGQIIIKKNIKVSLRDSAFTCRSWGERFSWIKYKLYKADTAAVAVHLA